MYVVPLDRLDRSQASLAGSKGGNLGDLLQAGFPVPAGFVVTREAYRAFLSANGLPVVLNELSEGIDDLHDTVRMDEVARRMQQVILAAHFPFDLRSALLDHYHALSGGQPAGEGKVPPALVAVRSSPILKGADRPSLGGEGDSFLNVLPCCEQFDGESCLRCWSPVAQSCDVIGAVQRSWSSQFSSRALSHRCEKGLMEDLPDMAVIVQRMINGEKSGVIHTANPGDGNRENMVVEATWGLGKAVGYGRSQTDYVLYDRAEGRVLRKIIASKETFLALDPQTALTRTMETPPDGVKAEVLSEDEMGHLARLALEVERHWGVPQEIEFTISAGEVFLLQTRPSLVP